MNKKHGKEGTKIYDVWVNMKQRCLNKNNHTYPYYGGRGILLCERWLDFKNFYIDMGDVPCGHTIDRIDPNGNYSKENCRWIIRKRQVRNLRKSIFIMFNEKMVHLADVCDELNLSYKVVFQRIKRDGLSPIEAISKPITRSRRGKK